MLVSNEGQNSTLTTNFSNLCIKILMKGRGDTAKLSKTPKKKFALLRLMNSSGDIYQDAYKECIDTKIKETWEVNGTAEEKGSAIRSALVESVEVVLDHESDNIQTGIKRVLRYLNHLFREKTQCV